jgi:hypothetical protein
MSTSRTILALAIWLGLCTIAAASTTVPGGIIASNTNWTLAGSPYIIQGTVDVRGAGNPRLTIEPGVEVRFAPNAALNISWNVGEHPNYRGELHAVGTLAQPILFTANNNNSGGWTGILIGNNADTGGSQSRLEHCIIEKAQRNLTLEDSATPDTLSHLELRLASNVGLQLAGASSTPLLDSLTIQGNQNWGILLAGANLPVISGCSITANGDDRLGYTGPVDDSITLDQAGYGQPVVFTGNTQISGGNNPRLTITAGSELRFKSGAQLLVSWDVGENNAYRGELHAVGTALHPILFTADNGLAGGWQGVHFGNNADTGGAQSLLEHCIIEKATRNLALQNTASPDTLRNLELRLASNEGLYLRGITSTPVIDQLSIHDNEDWGIQLAGTALPVIQSTTITSNGDDRLGFTGPVEGDVYLNLPSYSHSVVFTGSIQISGNTNPRLTLAPGSELRFKANSQLLVSWDVGETNAYRGELHAVGTPSQPILFTADNNTSGGWQGVHFGNNADTGGALSRLEHCIIERATRNLALQNTASPDSLIALETRLASDEGLYLRGVSTTPLLLDLDAHDNQDWGVLLAGAPLPVIQGGSIALNGDDRLGFTGPVEGDITLDLPGYGHGVVFTGNTQISGSTNPRLTLVPGSELRFKQNASLLVSWNVGETNSYRGELYSVGTPADSIVFTADNGIAGSWQGILFGNNADTGGAQSRMEYCRIEKGQRNLKLDNTAQPDTLQHLSLLEATVAGLELKDFQTHPLVREVEIRHCVTNSMILDATHLPVIESMLRTGNGEDRVLYQGHLYQDVTLDVAAYTEELVFGWVQVYGSASPRLTLTPGSELRFLPLSRLDVSYSSIPDNSYRGQLTAVGTPEAPIVLTADNDLPGGWNGLLFNGNADTGGATSDVEYLRVEKAIEGIKLLSTTQPDTLRHLELRDCSQQGLYLHTSTPLVANCVFEDNPVGLYTVNADTLVVGGSPEHANTFLGGATWFVENGFSGFVDATWNGWCLGDGVLPGDLIRDQLDDPALGLVDWSPTFGVEVLRIAIAYLPDTETLHFEWCPVAGAVGYNLYSAAEPGWPLPPSAVLHTTTTDTVLDLPLADFGGRRFFYATATLGARGASRSSGCR